MSSWLSSAVNFLEQVDSKASETLNADGKSSSSKTYVPSFSHLEDVGGGKKVDKYISRKVRNDLCMYIDGLMHPLMVRRSLQLLKAPALQRWLPHQQKVRTYITKNIRHLLTVSNIFTSPCTSLSLHK